MSLSSTQTSATQKLLDHIRKASSPENPPAPSAPLSPLRMPSPRSLFGKERNAVGVDVGDGRLLLAQSVPGNPPELKAVEIVPLPEGMTWATPGCADKVREALERFLPGGLDEADIWVRLEDGDNELRHYRIPKVGPKDRDAVARMTAGREKPFDENATVFDYRAGEEVLDKGVPRQPITAMIADKEAVERLKRTLAQAGIAPAGITSSGIATQNLYASGWLARPWDHFALAVIGEDFTRIEIFSGSSIALSRTIRTGLRSLVSALQESSPDPAPRTGGLPLETTGLAASGPGASGLGADGSGDGFPLLLRPASPLRELSLLPPQPTPAQAAAAPEAGLSHGEALHRLCASRRSPEEEENLLRRLSQPLGRMARQIERTADHFRNAMNMPPIEGVVVFAPGGCLSLARATFERLIGLPCLPLRLDGQSTPGAAVDLEKALREEADTGLLQAVGLSLSAASYTPNALMTYRDRQLHERHKRISLLSFGVTTLALMLLLACCGRLYLTYREEKDVRAKLEARIAAWQTAYAPDELRANLAATQKLQTQARQLARRRIAAALITELSAVTPDAIRLTGMRVTFNDVKPSRPDTAPTQRGGSRTARPEPEESAVAVITGTVTGDMLQRESRLAEFLSHLEHSPMVLSLLVEKQQTDTEILSFVATLRLT